MKPGPKARARRQQTRDARRRAKKSIGATLQARAEWSSLSGKVLAGQARTRRIPAYEIRIRRTVTTAPPALVQAFASAANQAARQAGKDRKG